VPLHLVGGGVDECFTVVYAVNKMKWSGECRCDDRCIPAACRRVGDVVQQSTDKDCRV